MLVEKQLLCGFAFYITLKLIYAYPHSSTIETVEHVLDMSEHLPRETFTKRTTDYKEQSAKGFAAGLSAETHEQRNSQQEGSLRRSKRALSGVSTHSEPDAPFDKDYADDMELAEINVFRPLFRYRVQSARQVPSQPPQFG